MYALTQSELERQVRNILNQFHGQKVTPQLEAQVKASIEVFLHQNMPAGVPFKVNTTMSPNGVLKVDVDTNIPSTRYAPYSKKFKYSGLLEGKMHSKTPFVQFFHDPKDLVGNEGTIWDDENMFLW